MKYLLFIIVYALLWCVSILPFRVLYVLSNIFYFLIYKVVKYRVKTVRYNLELTFPYLSFAERKAIEKKFYMHLCDLFLEMIKTITISPKELDKRFVYTNIDLMKAYETKQKSIIIMLPHYGNWEWINSLGLRVNFKGKIVLC